MNTPLDRIDRAEREATPGPWHFNDSTDPRGHKGEFRAPSPYNGFMLVGPWTNGADAALIALSRNHLRALIEAGRTLEQIRENARSWHGSETDTGHAKALAVIGAWCDTALAPLLAEEPDA